MDSPSRAQAPEMFNRIAKKYDVLNRILSFGLDIYWRRKLVEAIPTTKGLRVLDIACGTADLLLEVLRSRETAIAIGLDPAEGMLAIGTEKLDRFGFQNAVLQTGEAEQLPFLDNAFDVVTIGFGIRNAKQVDKALREMHRVLVPGGTALILEFSMPTFSLIRPLHRFYLRHVLPTIGGLLSGDRDAYVYLNKTIETFPFGNAFIGLMENAGFTQTKATPLSLGIATIYSGRK